VQTTFRKELINYLEAIAGSSEIDAEYVRVEFVEAKGDRLGELVDYYTDDLLRYAPFCDEFTADEIAGLSRLIAFFEEWFDSRGSWDQVRTRVSEELCRLRAGDRPSGE